jgi:HSP20 family protein
MTMQRKQESRGMTTWSPFRELDEIERRMEQLFGTSMMAPLRGTQTEGISWMPSLDLYETEDKFVVKAEIPGVPQEDISVSISDHMLTIEGERKEEKESKEGKSLRVERVYGKFIRSMELPSNVDTSKIQANYTNGILELSLPKTAESKAKTIQIQGSKEEKQGQQQKQTK